MAQKITVREQKQLHYSIRQRRVNGIFTLYSILLYAAYTIFTFLRYNSTTRSLSYISGLVLAPFLIWAIRRIIFWWFTRLTTSNAEYINALRSEQQEKIEELKQSTNFYSTKALLERFDSNFDKTNKRKSVVKGTAFGQQPSAPNSQPKIQKEASSKGKDPAQQLNRGHNSSNSIAAADFEFAPNLPSLQAPSSPGKPELPQSPTAQPPTQPPPPQQRHQQRGQPLQELQAYPLGPVYNANYQPSWYDKILDIIVGEDEYSPKSRYALICQNCRRHNGLAQPGELPQYVIYICPQCGFRNGQEKKKRKETKSMPASAAPSHSSHAGGAEIKPKRSTKAKSPHIFKELEDSDSEEDGEGERANTSTAPRPGTNATSNDEQEDENSSSTSEKEENDQDDEEEEEVLIVEKPDPKQRPGLHQRKKSRRGK